MINPAPAKVSFIIAAYNEEKYIVQCVDSCLNQTAGVIEVCITDDGSTDGTFEVLHKKYNNDCRVKVERFERNKGKVSAFNNSFSMATGDYIAIVGADDTSQLNRVESQLNFVIQHGLDISYCLMNYMDSDSFVFGTQPRFKGRSNPRLKILHDNFLSAGTAFLKRTYAEVIFPIPESLAFEDWWIGFRSVFEAKWAVDNNPLINYRIHAHNTVGNLKKYADVKRKNFQRHEECYRLFEEHLTDNGFVTDEFVATIHSCALFKKAFLKDSFIERLKLFIQSLRYFSLSDLNLYGRFALVSVFGVQKIGFIRSLFCRQM